MISIGYRHERLQLVCFEIFSSIRTSKRITYSIRVGRLSVIIEDCMENCETNDKLFQYYLSIRVLSGILELDFHHLTKPFAI